MLGEQLTSNSGTDHPEGLTQVALKALRESGRWAKFIGFVGLVWMAWTILNFILILTDLGPIDGSQFLETMRFMGGFFTIMIICYLLLIVSQFIFYLKTFHFGRAAEDMSVTGSEGGTAKMLRDLEQSFKAMAALFAVTTFIILFLVFYVYWYYGWMLSMMK